jgi:hypothetical protein
MHGLQEVNYSWVKSELSLRVVADFKTGYLISNSDQ